MEAYRSDYSNSRKNNDRIMDQDTAVKKGIFWLQQQDYIDIEDVWQFGEMMYGAGYDAGSRSRSRSAGDGRRPA